MGNTNYKLEDIVKLIENECGQKARLERKFSKEYLIGKVTEENLLNIGFKFKEYTQYDICPMYTMGNIVALFDDTILHIMED